MPVSHFLLFGILAWRSFFGTGNIFSKLCLISLAPANLWIKIALELKKLLTWDFAVMLSALSAFKCTQEYWNIQQSTGEIHRWSSRVTLYQPYDTIHSDPLGSIYNKNWKFDFFWILRSFFINFLTFDCKWGVLSYQQTKKLILDTCPHALLAIFLIIA